MTVGFDWNEFEQTLHDGLVRAVVAGGVDRCHAAVVGRIYREENGVIALPWFALRREDEDEDEDYRDGWLPPDLGGEKAWEKALTVEACSGTTRHWHRTFDRYLTALVRVCMRARTTLRTNGVTERDFVVLLLDDERHEALIRRVLTADEVRRHFPELDERSVERARIAALPPAERVTHLAGLLGTFDGPITSEDAESALRELGPVAFPALIGLLAVPGRAWQAAKLLADIGQPEESVIEALEAALAPEVAWVASALSRLGRLDLVLAHDLPPDVVVGAVAAPYTSFRDHAVTTPPLDYQPLARFIEHRPDCLPELQTTLAPGTGYCEITPGEVDTAVLGLSSPHAIIRRYAVGVLGERRLGRSVGRRVLPLLGEAMRQDPDPSVRRLAIMSMLFWHRDSRHLTATIREALNDPAVEVREAAAYWLREQDPDQSDRPEWPAATGKTGPDER